MCYGEKLGTAAAWQVQWRRAEKGSGWQTQIGMYHCTVLCKIDSRAELLLNSVYHATPRFAAEKLISV